jgi:hypothetical protein
VRSDFVPANGQRVSVYDRMERQAYTESVKIGETRDSRGNVSEHFATRSGTELVRVVYGQQGASPVDDESFYRIVGDAEATERYDAYHSAGRTRSAVGIGIAAISAALTAASIVILATPISQGDAQPCSSCAQGYEYPMNNLGYAAIGGVIVGGLGLIAGTLLWTSGASVAGDSSARLYPLSETAMRMKDGAARYNVRIPGSAPR